MSALLCDDSQVASSIDQTYDLVEDKRLTGTGEVMDNHQRTDSHPV
jgi:hypothetical protein